MGKRKYGLTDHEEMLAVRDGDIGKLGLLFEKHHTYLFNFFLLLTKNRQASEDMVQDVFYRMLKYRRTYRSDGNFKTWMFSIARNARKDFFREHKAEFDTIDETNDFASGDPNLEELLVRNDEVALVRRALDGLPDDKREILIMSRFHDMRYEEIGNVLGCSVGTVKVRIYRAMRALTESYKKLSGEISHGL